MNEPLKSSDGVRENITESSLTVLKVFTTLKEYKYLLLSIVLVATISSIIFALSSREVFRSEMTLISAQVGNQSTFSSVANQLSGIAGSVGLDLGAGMMSGNQFYTSLAVLQSRSFLESYIRKNDLMPKLFADQWDIEKQSWKDNSQPSYTKAFEIFSKKIFFNHNERTNILAFSVEWNNPVDAAKIANDLINTLNNYMQQKAINEMKNNIHYLEEQLDKTSIVNSKTVVYKIIEEQTKAMMMANVREEYAFQVIDPAVPPEKRIRPHRRLIVEIGFALGLIMGIFGIYLIEFWKNFPKTLTNQKEL